MSKFEQQEILNMLGALSKSGLNFMIPDTDVQYYSDGVKCGIPTELSPYNRDIVTLPKQMLGNSPTIVIRADGDSMCNAGINSGDDLTVQLTTDVMDGDVVIATINGESTAKTFFTSNDGRKWLLPQNEHFKPIPLNSEDAIQIYGKVIAVTRSMPRTIYSDCARILRANIKEKQETTPPTDEHINKAVNAIMPMVKYSRQWFSIFRVLIDRGYYHANDFEAFKADIDRWCPNATYKVDAHDLSKMARESFCKCVSLWNSMYAPVSGKRFTEYLTLARSFNTLLSGI